MYGQRTVVQQLSLVEYFLKTVAKSIKEDAIGTFSVIQSLMIKTVAESKVSSKLQMDTGQYDLYITNTYEGLILCLS